MKADLPLLDGTVLRGGWNGRLMIADLPKEQLERRRLEDAAGLEHGSLDKWLD